MRALDRLEPRCAACGQLLPRPDSLPEPGMGYKHEPERLQAHMARWHAAMYAGELLASYKVQCVDCGGINTASFYREQD